VSTERPAVAAGEHGTARVSKRILPGVRLLLLDSAIVSFPRTIWFRHWEKLLRFVIGKQDEPSVA